MLKTVHCSRYVYVVVSAIALWACSEETQSVVPALLDDPVWPESDDNLSFCESDGGLLPDLPELNPPYGNVQFDQSAAQQPVGVSERIEVTFLDPEGKDVDKNIIGELRLETDEFTFVEESGPIVEGRSEVVVRFETPGVHEIKGSIVHEERRVGKIEYLAYDARIPIWNMTISDEDLDFIMENPGERHKVSCVLTIDGVSYLSLVRIHGGSSRYYRKKSFRFDLASGLTLPNGSNHLILRAEWADKSLLRNYLGFEMFHQGTWLAASETEIVHFRINDRYYGVMWHVERVDGDFLRSRGMNPEGSMYEADPEPEFWVPGGNLTPLRRDDLYPHVYDHKKGNIVYDDLIVLIEDTLQRSSKRFNQTILEEVNVNDVLVYIAANAVFQNHDHIKKNYYLYRDPVGSDTRWTIIPWDLDLTFGHLWTPEDDILSEEMFFDGSLYMGEEVPEHSYYNQLISRLLGVPEFEDRFLDYVDYLADNVLTRDFIDKRIEHILCLAGRDILADPRKRASNEEYLDRVDELRLFVEKRREFILP